MKDLLDLIPVDKIFELVGTLVAVLLVPLIFKQFDRAKQDKIKAITHGAYLAVAAVAKLTSTNLDDMLALVIQRVEIEMGRHLKPAELKRVTGIALAMHGDPTKPDLGAPTSSAIEKALRTPGHVIGAKR